MRNWQDVEPEEILSFWFPADLPDAEEDAMRAFWNSRMHGGMDEAIIRDYADTATAAAEGRYDHWAETADGRLALILVLDQFPRSLWRDTPAAFGQDIKACRLSLAGLQNGHYAALPHWYQQQFYIISLSHCEGPDHLERLDLCVQLNEKMLAEAATATAKTSGERALAQAHRVHGIIERFGRHPHRNPIYGRISTPEEQAYIDTGDFPHVNGPPEQS